VRSLASLLMMILPEFGVYASAVEQSPVKPTGCTTGCTTAGSTGGPSSRLADCLGRCCFASYWFSCPVDMFSIAHRNGILTQRVGSMIYIFQLCEKTGIEVTDVL